MKKFLLTVLLLCFALCLQASSPLAIGSKVPDIKLDVWYKNKKAPVETWLGKKTVAILFVTTTMPDPLMIKRVEGYVQSLKKENVEIFFVANGLPRNAKNIPAWKNLTIPTAFDLKSELFKTLGGTMERIPFWVVITPQRELAWRGRINLLPALIREMKSGKYSIKDAVRRERFTTAIGKLLREKKYAQAVELITAEQKIEPTNAELLGLKCNLLNRLKKNKEALKEIDRVIALKPNNFVLYDFKLRFIRQTASAEPVLPVFEAIAKNFQNQPSFLLGMVKKEMALPLSQINPEGAYILARTAAASTKFRNKQEEGLVRLGYARILHYCGRPDLAVIEAQKAVKLLNGKNKKMAENVRDHFAKIIKMSQKIK